MPRRTLHVYAAATSKLFKACLSARDLPPPVAAAHEIQCSCRAANRLWAWAAARSSATSMLHVHLHLCSPLSGFSAVHTQPRCCPLRPYTLLAARKHAARARSTKTPAPCSAHAPHADPAAATLVGDLITRPAAPGAARLCNVMPLANASRPHPHLWCPRHFTTSCACRRSAAWRAYGVHPTRAPPHPRRARGPRRPCTPSPCCWRRCWPGARRRGARTP